MPLSNDIEKHGSDLVGLGAELDRNESPPPSSQIPTFPPSSRNSKGEKSLSFALPVEARSYKLVEIATFLSFEHFREAWEDRPASRGESHLSTLLWLLYLSLCGQLETQTLTSGVGTRPSHI